MFKLSERTKRLVEALDKKANERAGYNDNPMSGAIDCLTRFGKFEIGWRESCGSTDATMHTYRAWCRVAASMKRDGITLMEERGKHGNGYATIKGGFWNSIIYRVEGHTTM